MITSFRTHERRISKTSLLHVYLNQLKDEMNRSVRKPPLIRSGIKWLEEPKPNHLTLEHYLQRMIMSGVAELYLTVPLSCGLAQYSSLSIL